MAQLRLQPPDQFNFKNPDDWPRWKRHFQQYRVASGLTGDDEAKQISTLLYCLGEQAEAVLGSTDITEDERKSYDTVVAKLDRFFQVRRNVIFERAGFNQRNQQEGEGAEHYIMALYELATYCEYGDLTSEMIRDRLVVGIRDNALSKRLQLDSKLTLETAKKAIRQHEVVHEQQRELKGVQPSCLEALTGSDHRNRRPRGQRGRRTVPKQTPTSTPAPKTCTRCGKGTHPREKCPARDATCHRCQRKGHYGVQCYSKTQASLSEVTSMDTAFLDTAFMDAVTSGAEGNAWLAHIQLGDQETLFKLDTVLRSPQSLRKPINTWGSHNFTPLASYSVAPPGNPYKCWGNFWESSLMKPKFLSNRCLWSKD